MSSLKSVYYAAKRLLWIFLRPLYLKLRPMNSSIKNWVNDKIVAGKNQYQYDKILDGTTFSRKLPQTVNDEIHPNFTQRLTYDLPELFLARLPGARVVGSSGLVISPDGQWFVESSWETYWLERDSTYQSLTLPKIYQKSGSFTSIIILWCNNNYFHWMFDALTRLPLIAKLSSEVKILVPDNLSAWQTELLDLLDIAPERRVSFGKHCHWQFEEFYFTSQLGRTGNMNPWAVQWLREQLLAKCGDASSEKRKRIYISRKWANSRTVVNDEEVTLLLESYGFETVFCEKLSVADQIKLFSQAEIVVAPHGAGNTNLLFAPLDTVFIELFELTYVKVCYWSLCEAIGLEYWYIMGQSIGTNSRGANIMVPIDLLQKTLKIVIDARS